MKGTGTIILIITALLLVSCGGTKKNRKSSAYDYKPPVQVEVPKPEPVIEKPVAKPEIREVQEKLVPIQNVPVDPYSYFVIIGSFRGYDNAIKYQQEILREGFKSSLLRNEAGLYRVSVLATDDVVAARSEVRRIRDKFPKYNDTWLLIHRK